MNLCNVKPVKSMSHQNLKGARQREEVVAKIKKAVKDLASLSDANAINCKTRYG